MVSDEWVLVIFGAVTIILGFQAYFAWFRPSIYRSILTVEQRLLQLLFRRREPNWTSRYRYRVARISYTVGFVLFLLATIYLSVGILTK